jgi:hypothetical protein
LAGFDEICQILFLLAITNTATCQKQKPSFKVKFSLAIWLNLATSAYL